MQLKGLGECCKLLQRVPGPSPGCQRICVHFRLGNRRWRLRFSVVVKWEICLQIYVYVKDGIHVQYAVVSMAVYGLLQHDTFPKLGRV